MILTTEGDRLPLDIMCSPLLLRVPARALSTTSMIIVLRVARAAGGGRSVVREGPGHARWRTATSKPVGSLQLVWRGVAHRCRRVPIRVAPGAAHWRGA